jgi:Diacylglycerol kinase accessory domain.
MKDEFSVSGEDFVIYPSSHEKSKEPLQGKQEVYLKGNPSVFLCLNIPSYMAGCNPWEASKG